MKLRYRLVEDLTPEEQAAACRDTGHSLAGLADVLVYHAGVRWRVLDAVRASHIRGGHVVEPRPPQASGKRLTVEVRE